MNVIIVNYNSGNLASLYNSFLKVAKERKIKVNIIISEDPQKIKNADKIILPGVGDFSNCKKELLKIDGMLEALNEVVLKKKKPFLGICIGMQLMAKKSFERVETDGLGFFDSQVIKISHKDHSLKVPHMGWNNTCSLKDNILMRGFNDSSIFYFLHSYYFECDNDINSIASTFYGKKFTCAVISAFPKL